jgi:hypothetical protein
MLPFAVAKPAAIQLAGLLGPYRLARMLAA